MVSRQKYSKEENELLEEEILRNDGVFSQADLTQLVEFWPGFFSGKMRTELAIYRQLIRLAQKQNWILHITTPKRQNRTIPKSSIKQEKSSKFSELLKYAIRIEIEKTCNRIASATRKLIQDVIEENKSMKEELRILRPYKGLVQREFSKQATYEGLM